MRSKGIVDNKIHLKGLTNLSVQFLNRSNHFFFMMSLIIVIKSLVICIALVSFNQNLLIITISSMSLYLQLSSDKKDSISALLRIFFILLLVLIPFSIFLLNTSSTSIATQISLNQFNAAFRLYALIIVFFIQFLFLRIS